MPIYEYQCRKCGTFEVTQRITDDPLGRCPTCRAKVAKLISNTSFQLKGSGWYVTDYAGKDAKKEETGEGKREPAETPKASSGGGGTETKDSPKKAETKDSPKKKESKSEATAA